MVHLIGEIAVQESLGDSNYNLLVQAIKLRKIVEMYQWVEDYTESYTEEGTNSRSYYYYKDWSESTIDSRNFHSLTHQNPREKPMESKIFITEKAFLGGFEICDEAKGMFDTWLDGKEHNIKS